MCAIVPVRHKVKPGRKQRVWICSSEKQNERYSYIYWTFKVRMQLSNAYTGIQVGLDQMPEESGLPPWGPSKIKSKQVHDNDCYHLGYHVYNHVVPVHLEAIKHCLHSYRIRHWEITHHRPRSQLPLRLLYTLMPCPNFRFLIPADLRLCWTPRADKYIYPTYRRPTFKVQNNLD
jgi:hypothetical protein